MDFVAFDIKVDTKNHCILRRLFLSTVNVNVMWELERLILTSMTRKKSLCSTTSGTMLINKCGMVRPLSSTTQNSSTG
jgi:hypothetical protein